MKKLQIPLLLSTLAFTAFAADDASLRNWPAWRGPLANGVSPQANPPITWSETSHVKWKSEIPGSGNASPVVWEDQVFLLTAIPVGKVNGSATNPVKPSAAPAASGNSNQASGGSGPNAGGRGMVEQPTEEQQFTVISFDRNTGKIRWQHSPRTILPHEGHHKDHGYASASPITDGEVLIAYFGSRGLFAYDLKGHLLWEKILGQQTTRNGFGEGSSPALHGNTLVIVWDHEGEDFVVALDKRNGRELWRKKRDESTNWTTPLILDHEGQKQAIINSGNKVRSYDLASGETLWEAGGQTQNAVPTPVAGQDRVYVMSGWKGAALQAITLGRKGDLTGTDAIAWSHNKSTPYVPSPLLYGDLLYFYANNNAQLSILDARQGRPYLEAERLEGIFGVYASPVGAAGRVYLTGRNGVVWVINQGPKLEVLAKNKLDDGFDASPALVGNQLILRGRKHLYSLAETSSASK